MLKGPVLDVALLHDEHMLRSALRSRFTASEVAADWHDLMIPQRIMRPSIARVANTWTRGAACRHKPPPQSATLGLHSVARKLLLISRPAKGRRLS